MKIIVTGASKGIGHGIAKVLADKGCKVGLLARSEAKLAELQTQLGESCCYQAADLRDADATNTAIKALIDELGGCDGLINNAGLIIRKPVHEISLEEWQAMVETNINGPFYAVKAVLSTLMSQGSGHIINISSISGKLPLKDGSGYAASKYGLTGFSESLFLELREAGIKVSTIYPGSVDSASHRHDPEADHSWKVSPEEVGESCWHLLNTSPQNCIRELEIRPLYKPS